MVHKGWYESKSHATSFVEVNILSYFPKCIGNQILCIPLIVEEQNDSLILKKERNGIYTVRSGYYVHVDKGGKTQGSR